MSRYDPRFGYPAPPRPPGNGLGTAGFVVGLIGLLFSWIPIVGVIAWPLVILGLVLSGIGFSRARSGQATNAGLAAAGLICSGIGLVVCVLYVALLGTALSSSAAHAARGAVPAPALSTGSGGGDTAVVVNGIEQQVREGSFTFTVTGVERPGRVLDDGLTSKAQGTWVLVRLTVTNEGDESGLFSSSRQKLLDAQGRKFDADAGAAILSVRDSDSFLTTINPGNSVRGTLVFDIPERVTPTAIELHESYFSRGVVVGLTG